MPAEGVRPWDVLGSRGEGVWLGSGARTVAAGSQGPRPAIQGLEQQARDLSVIWKN